ncbi:hypothetical protein CEE44_04255 [Candidatus Woesearchaeota archaeon B3_Woes]|nr:MAG: hypothetical protein CEE44_04255 [Candidatus Woesearchaeota archaeon B3_Woes]
MSTFFQQEQQLFEALKNTLPVEALRHQTGLDFIVLSRDKVLHPLVAKNDIIVVAGSYFGDEGKGKITDAVAQDELVEIITRMNSGENAGHTVCHNDKKYVFHLTPSGIMVPDKQVFIGPECVMDPISFVEKEVSSLTQIAPDYKERFKIGNVHIVGPYHKIMDFALSKSNSSTLMGMSYVHASKSRKKCLRLDDLFNSRDFQAKTLKGDLATYHALIKHSKQSEEQILDNLREFSEIRKIPDHLFEFLEVRDKVEFIIDLYRRNVVENPDFPERADVNHAINQGLEQGKKVLIESPQSFWLSNATEKHWRSATSAQTHAAGVLASTEINTSKYTYVVINIAKTPGDSRVGIGANPSSYVPQNYFSSHKPPINNLDDLGDACIDFDTIQKKYFTSIQSNGTLRPTEYTDKTGTYSISEAIAISSSRKFGEKGATTKKPRVLGVFDCVAAYQVNKAQGPHLSLSAMDRGDHQDFVGLTVAYIYHNPSEESTDSNGITYNNGDIIKIGDPFPFDNVLKHCYPIVKVMPGWKDTPIAADKRNPDDKLPRNIQNFIGTIESLTGFSVLGIGNGQNTDDMIYIKRKNNSEIVI